MIRNNILNFILDDIKCNQNDLVHGKSILSNILESIDTIKEYLMEWNKADFIYFDFSKIFDTVSHYYLQVKMKNLDISQQIVNILR